MANWIFVESYFNWKQDLKNGFEYLGINLSKYEKKQIKKNDKIVTYISKIKKISDIRQIVDDNIFETPTTFDYKKSFTKCIKTKLLKCLDENKWISFVEFAPHIEIFQHEENPGMILLNAPVELSKRDYNYLYGIIEKIGN